MFTSTPLPHVVNTDNPLYIMISRTSFKCVACAPMRLEGSVY